MRRSIFLTSEVNANSTDTETSPKIQNGKTWVVEKVGFTEPILDIYGYSSEFALQWGSSGNWDDIRIAAIAGNTIEMTINESFIGDGTKRFRMIRKNNSDLDKRLGLWIIAYEKS